MHLIHIPFLRKISGLLVSLCCLAAMAGQTAHAQSIITVTGTADGDLGTLAGNSTCDLREAIDAANSDSVTGQCDGSGGGSGDTINFDASLNGSTITLINGDLLLTDPVTIGNSDGTVVTVSGDGNSRIFDLNSSLGSNETVTLRSLVLIDGAADDGGALRAEGGTLALVEMTVTDNVAAGDGGAIFSTVPTTITGSTLQENGTANGTFGSPSTGDGGAIYATASLYITDTLIMSNTTGNGFSHNIALPDDGGESGDGGGIYATDDLTLINATITGNATGAGGNGSANPSGNGYDGGDSGNGGGIYATGTIRLTGSSVADNQTGDPGNGGSAGPSNQPGSSGDRGFGGGILLNGGALIADDGRIYANGADVGGGLFNGGGAMALEKSLLYSNMSDGDGGGIASTGALTLTNTSVYSNTAGDDGGAIAAQGGSISIVDGTLYDNGAADDGGAIYTTVDLSLLQSTVEGNEAGDDGGGLDNDGGLLLLFNSTIRNNRANAAGGGIDSDASLTIQNSTIISNSASSGGGIHHDSAALVIQDSEIVSNTAVVDGGGVLNDGGTASVGRSTIQGNLAGGSGGGFYTLGAAASLQMVRSAVIENTASTGRGGGLYLLNGVEATVVNSTVSLNRAAGLNNGVEDGGNGGGIFTGSPIGLANQLTLINSTVTLNEAAGRGGGIDYNRGSAVVAPGDTLVLKNTILAGNSAGVNQPNCHDYDLDNDAATNAPVGLNANNLLGNDPSDDCGAAGSDLALTTLGLSMADVLELVPALNGGSTLNHRPLLDSPVIEAGDNTLCTASPINSVDQRGLERPGGDTSLCDIGSVERQDVTDPVADLYVTKTVTPTTLTPGSILPGAQASGTATFVVTYGNRGNVAAGPVLLTDTMPAGLFTESITTSPALGSPAQQELPDGSLARIYTLPTLEAGATGTITLTASAIEAMDNRTITGTATISGAMPEGDESDNSDSAAVTVTDLLPQINIEKSVSLDGVTFADEIVAGAGDQVTYRISVTNGTGELLDVEALTDDAFAGPPACGITFDELTGNGTRGCDYTLTLDANDGITYTNTVTITVRDDDGNSVTASDAAVVRVPEVSPLVSVEKTVDADGDGTFGEVEIAEAGSTVAYRVVVTNRSGEAFTIATVADDQSPGACAGLINSSVAPGASTLCTYSTALPDTGGSPFVNTIEVTVVDDEGNPAAASASATVGIAGGTLPEFPDEGTELFLPIIEQ